MIFSAKTELLENFSNTILGLPRIKKNGQKWKMILIHYLFLSEFLKFFYKKY